MQAFKSTPPRVAAAKAAWTFSGLLLATAGRERESVVNFSYARQERELRMIYVHVDSVVMDLGALGVSPPSETANTTTVMSLDVEGKRTVSKAVKIFAELRVTARFLGGVLKHSPAAWHAGERDRQRFCWC